MSLLLFRYPVFETPNAGPDDASFGSDPAGEKTENGGESPLRDASRRPLLPVGLSVLSALVLFACMAFPPFATSQAAPFIALPVMVCAGVFLCIRSRAVGSILLIMLPAGLLSVFTMSFIIPAFYLSLVCGTVCVSLLITHKRMLFILPPVIVSFAVAFLVTGSALPALAALLPLPAGILLAFFTMSNSGRTASVCAAASGFVLWLLVLGSVFIFQSRGAISAEIINSFIEEVRASLAESLMSVRALMAEQFPATAAVLDEATVQNAINELFNILPALFLIVCNVIAFITQSVLLSSCRVMQDRGICPSGVYVTPETRTFTMSAVSAVLFVVCLIAALISRNSNSAFYTVVTNLHMILAPGLFIVGFFAFVGRSLFGRPPRLFPVILLAGFFFFATYFCILFMACYGSFVVVRYTIRSRFPSGSDSNGQP